MKEVYFKAGQELANHLIHAGYEERNHPDHAGNKGKRSFYLFTNRTKRVTARTMFIRFDYVNIEAWKRDSGQFANWYEISKTELYKLIAFQKQKKHSEIELESYSLKQ